MKKIVLLMATLATSLSAFADTYGVLCAAGMSRLCRSAPAASMPQITNFVHSTYAMQQSGLDQDVQQASVRYKGETFTFWTRILLNGPIIKHRSYYRGSPLFDDLAKRSSCIAEIEKYVESFGDGHDTELKIALLNALTWRTHGNDALFIFDIYASQDEGHPIKLEGVRGTSNYFAQVPFYGIDEKLGCDPQKIAAGFVRSTNKAKEIYGGEGYDKAYDDMSKWLQENP